MYAGTIIRNSSGSFVGVHQKIDRVAYRLFCKSISDQTSVPTLPEILHFEGNNGPDGLKRKSPSADDPWHFIDPAEPHQGELLRHISNHYQNLVMATKQQNLTRAAFEMAWLAHAIVDGLTPAHHYPLADKIEELWGKPKDLRNSVFDKNIALGETALETISKNWQYWGAKGVWSTHFMFEWGVASSIKTTRFMNLAIDAEKTDDYHAAEVMFLRSLDEIYQLDMYKRFWQQGWTTSLSRETRRVLIPKIIQVVAVFWNCAYKEAKS